MIRDYVPSRRRSRDPLEPARQAWSSLSATDLVDPSAVAKVLGIGTGEHLDGAVAPRGYRLLTKVPRLPSNVVEGLVDHFGTLQKPALGRHRRPAGRRGRRRACGPAAFARG
ncbi:hypothetical protein [Nocardioides convexus]|uniref:hypothetical protein n=1 Tax=Nocardioides convexus TaxID=2712224 RepID=UPI0024186F39|nr:hypothetical protein [Nocardioides convexus]